MYRRHFIRNSALASVGASLASSIRLFAAKAKAVNPLTTQRGPYLLKGDADDLRITPADATVLNFVAGFGARALFTGGCVAGKSARGAFRSTHVLAQISDLAQHRELVTQRGAILGEGMAIGNSICFNYLGTTFQLETLLPEEFEKRIADIKNGLRPDGTPMVYAHEALLYEPATKTLTDPFKTFNGKVATLKRLSIPNGYSDLAEGNLDLTVYRLGSSARDQSDLNALLSRTVTDGTEALKIVAAFLQKLSLNSQVNGAAAVQTLTGTRMMRSASQLALGCDSQRVAGNFAQQRSRFAADITDGAIWHALFQTAEVSPDGLPKTAKLALAGGCEFETFLTMQEFQKLGVIKASSTFKVYV